jgi:hypothetical protein
VPLKQSSIHLAEKESTVFVPLTTKAIQRKALRESLAACSASLKKQVAGHKLLKRKNPIGALDLRRLARAARLSYSGRRSVEVTASGTTTST